MLVPPDVEGRGDTPKEAQNVLCGNAVFIQDSGGVIGAFLYINEMRTIGGRSECLMTTARMPGIGPVLEKKLQVLQVPNCRPEVFSDRASNL
jgi:hypothetical protein